MDIIEKLNAHVTYLKKFEDIEHDKSIYAIEAAVKEIESLRSQLSSQWISVDDRLPNINTKVLAYAEFGLDDEKTAQQCELIKQHGETFWKAGNKSVNNLTHWMPLPALPKD